MFYQPTSRIFHSGIYVGQRGATCPCEIRNLLAPSRTQLADTPRPCAMQLDLLSAPWPMSLEDGGQEVLKHRVDWANCDNLPVLDTRHQVMLQNLSSTDKLATLRRDLLASGSSQDTVFETHAASTTEYSKAWFLKHGYKLCCFHSLSKKPIPVFRGLRVRIGIHSGIADVVTTNESTKRKMYGGRVMQVLPWFHKLTQRLVLPLGWFIPPSLRLSLLRLEAQMLRVGNAPWNFVPS